jgi:hypothetical protein
MSETSNSEDRLLSVAEREMVAQTRPPGIAKRSKAELQDLGKRLREARDRARRMGSQQKREMRGKAKPRGAAPARENAGTEAKTQVLVDALKRVTAALRKLNAPKPADVLRKALAKKQATPPHHPEPGRTAAKGMQPKVSSRRTVKADPREIGRVSQAVKVAQAKRDR